MATGPRGVIRIDPFFEGESPIQPAGDGGLIQANTGVAAQTQAPVDAAHYPPGYTDVGDQRLGDGRTMAQVMPSGRAGLRGVVIPHAVPDGGVPLGVRPHETADIEVNVDPHLEGQSARVRLGDINAATIAQAEERAREVTPDPYDTATIRMRSSAVMQGLANIAATSTVAAVPAPAASAPPAAVPGITQGSPATTVAQAPQPQRRSRPLAHFGPEPPPEQFEGRPLRAIDMSGPSVPAEYGSLPPGKHVTFEIEGFGLHRAQYHDILVEDGFLVLVYDEGFVGGMMYEPPSGPQTPSMALEVAGEPQVHLVHTTGFSYSYQGCRFCVLMIERSAPVGED